MLIGRPAPDFRMLTTQDPNTLEHVASLADYRGRWLMLFFYPSDFTFVCPTEMIAINEALPEFTERGCDVLGVSTDGVFAHIAWMEFHIGQLDYPLASDRTHEVSRAYEVLDESAGQAVRAAFVIDPEGVVRYQGIYDDRVGRSIDEILRVLDALQRPGRSFAQYSRPPAQRSADCGRAALPAGT